MSTRPEFMKELQELAGEEDLSFVIPYPFLPPRLLSESKQRNLILHLDVDLGASITWQGARLYVWRPLTPAAAAKLLTDAVNRMALYADAGMKLAQFLRENGSTGGVDPAGDDPTSRREDRKPELKETEVGN